MHFCYVYPTNESIFLIQYDLAYGEIIFKIWILDI